MIFNQFDLANVKTLNKDDLFSWHGLPALVVDDNKIAIFSNIGNGLKVIELSPDEVDDPKTFEEAKQNHLFECIDKNAKKNHPSLTLVMSVT